MNAIIKRKVGRYRGTSNVNW